MVSCFHPVTPELLEDLKKSGGGEICSLRRRYSGSVPNRRGRQSSFFQKARSRRFPWFYRGSCIHCQTCQPIPCPHYAAGCRFRRGLWRHSYLPWHGCRTGTDEQDPGTECKCHVRGRTDGRLLRPAVGRS